MRYRQKLLMDLSCLYHMNISCRRMVKMPFMIIIVDLFREYREILLEVCLFSRQALVSQFLQPVASTKSDSFFLFFYRSICIIDDGASRRRTRNTRFRARRADHSTTSMCTKSDSERQFFFVIFLPSCVLP